MSYPSWRVLEGDCIEALAAMDEASIDAVVCDPPYGIGFMGKEWDGKAIADAAAKDRATRKSLGPASASRPGRAEPRSKSAYGNEAIIAGPVRGGADFQAWCETWAREALRVLKPGGHLLAFGGTRTYHRLTCAIEDAGFEVRDCIAWMYGSGFPKSLDVSKAIDKAAGAEREVVATERSPFRMADPKMGNAFESTQSGDTREVDADGYIVRPITAPATPDAERWQGWGTALKPSFEPIVVARKPLAGTVAANVLAHGTGALNVDGCRVDTGSRPLRVNAGLPDPTGDGYGAKHGSTAEGVTSVGRWPANVVLDPEAAAMLDEQTGELHSQDPATRRSRSTVEGVTAMGTGASVEYADRGGASRFFYVAKAGSAERNNGARNTHPTVKPIALMQWLVRLVTPPGGIVLDPFAGSGTTGIAAVREGFAFVGIEREAEYAAICRARIAWWAVQPVDLDLDRLLIGAKERAKVVDLGQGTLDLAAGA